MKLLSKFAHSTENGPIVPLIESRMNLAYASIQEQTGMLTVHSMYHVDMIGRPVTVSLGTGFERCYYCGRTR